MQFTLDSLFARPGSAPTGGGEKKESSGTGLRYPVGDIDDHIYLVALRNKGLKV